jgi:hypothetical protein
LPDIFQCRVLLLYLHHTKYKLYDTNLHHNRLLQQGHQDFHSRRSQNEIRFGLQDHQPKDRWLHGVQPITLHWFGMGRQDNMGLQKQGQSFHSQRWQRGCNTGTRPSIPRPQAQPRRQIPS